MHTRWQITGNLSCLWKISLYQGAVCSLNARNVAQCKHTRMADDSQRLFSLCCPLAVPRERDPVKSFLSVLACLTFHSGFQDSPKPSCVARKKENSSNNFTLSKAWIERFLGCHLSKARNRQSKARDPHIRVSASLSLPVGAELAIGKLTRTSHTCCSSDTLYGCLLCIDE